MESLDQVGTSLRFSQTTDTRWRQVTRCVGHEIALLSRVSGGTQHLFALHKMRGGQDQTSLVLRRVRGWTKQRICTPRSAQETRIRTAQSAQTQTCFWQSLPSADGATYQDTEHNTKEADLWMMRTKQHTKGQLLNRFCGHRCNLTTLLDLRTDDKTAQREGYCKRHKYRKTRDTVPRFWRTCSTLVAGEPTNSTEKRTNKSLRSNSDRRAEYTADESNQARLINVLMFSTRITKMWRCFVNQAASSQKTRGKKLAIPIEAAMPCKIRRSKHGETCSSPGIRKTKFAWSRRIYEKAFARRSWKTTLQERELIIWTTCTDNTSPDAHTRTFSRWVCHISLMQTPHGSRCDESLWVFSKIIPSSHLVVRCSFDSIPSCIFFIFHLTDNTCDFSSAIYWNQAEPLWLIGWSDPTHTTAILCTSLFLCLTQWKYRKQKQQWRKNGKTRENTSMATDNESETKER